MTVHWHGRINLDGRTLTSVRTADGARILVARKASSAYDVRIYDGRMELVTTERLERWGEVRELAARLAQS